MNLRHQNKSPLYDLPHEGLEVGSVRLPINGSQDPSQVIRRYGPWLSSDHSITSGPRWIDTCEASHSRAMLRDVGYYCHDFPKDLQIMGRNLKMIFDQCGGNLPWNAPVSGKRKVLHYHMEGEGRHCEIELSGFAEPERKDSTQDHIYRVMRGRFKGKMFEYEYLSYQVPELDWPYLKDIVRESGRSFRASWE